jgi:hypothetical protein
VFDLPSYPAEDMGDVHLPSEKVAPYMFSHGKHSEAPGVSHRVGRFPTAKSFQSQSLAQVFLCVCMCVYVCVCVCVCVCE